MNYQHISAGETAPVFVEYPAADVVQVSLQRLADNLYWDGIDWVALETMLATVEHRPGLYMFTAPDLLDGHYLLMFQNSLLSTTYIHLFAGSYKFTSTLELCNLYGIIVDAFNKPVRNALMRLRTVPSAPVNNIIVSYEPHEVFTDDAGNFNIELIREHEYLLDIPAIRYSKRILIPDAASVRFEDL